MRRMLLLCCALWLGADGCQSAALTSAKLYLQQEEPQKAKEQLEQAAQSEPANPEVHFLLGKIYGAEGDYAAMGSAFGRSLSVSPRFAKDIQAERYRYWAKEYNDGVRLAAGEQEVPNEFDVKVKPIEEGVRVPVQPVRKPDFAAARAAFQRAAQVDSTRLESWRNLAFVYYHLDSLSAAAGAYQRILAMASADTATHFSLGVLYLRQNAHQEALQAFNEFLKLKPGDVDGLVNLGFAHMQLAHYAEAESIYRQAIALDPMVEQPHYNLGNLYWKQKNYPAAREAYQQALALAPQDDDARYNLAVTCLALEQWDEALPLLEELAARLPDNAGVWQGLGQVHAVQGRIDESKQAYAKADALTH